MSLLFDPFSSQRLRHIIYVSSCISLTKYISSLGTCSCHNGLLCKHYSAWSTLSCHFAFYTPQTLFLPTVELAHWWFKIFEDVSPGCGFSGEHHYSQKTIEEVVNRRLRKRRTDGKTHKNETKALLEGLLVKAFGEKTINHHDECYSYRSMLKTNRGEMRRNCL